MPGGKVCQGDFFVGLTAGGPSHFGVTTLHPHGLSLLCGAGVGISGGEKRGSAPDVEVAWCPLPATLLHASVTGPGNDARLFISIFEVP